MDFELPNVGQSPQADEAVAVIDVDSIRPSQQEIEELAKQWAADTGEVTLAEPDEEPLPADTGLIVAVQNPVDIEGADPTPPERTSVTPSRRPAQVRALPHEVRRELPNGLELVLEQITLHQVDLDETAPQAQKSGGLFDFGNETGFTAATAMTALHVRITNTAGQPVEYLGLSGLDGTPSAWLSDSGSSRRQKWLPAQVSNGTVRDAVARRTLRPGESCDDLIVFPPDAFNGRRLILHISGLSVGSERRVDIPLY